MDVVCIGKINRDCVEGKCYLGGSATNTAIALSKFGLKISLIGKIGNDNIGQELLDEIKKWGIDTSQITVAEAETGHYDIKLKNGNKNMIGKIGANEFLISKNIKEGHIKQFKIIHVSSIKPKIAMYVSEIVNKNHLLLSVDPGYLISNAGLETVKSILKNCTFFFPTEQELLRITNTNLNKSIKEIMNTGLKFLILKKADTIEFVSKDENFEVPIKKSKILSSIGIGDNFAAGFIKGYLDKKSFKESIKLGIETADRISKKHSGN